jgi:glycosyltransferase involved in cell wall biosynthesis
MFPASVHDQIHVVKNAIDTDVYYPRPDVREEMRKQFGFDGLVLGHTARLSQEKNQKFLLQVMAEVVRRDPKAKLLLVGEGELRAELEAQTAQLGLEDMLAHLVEQLELAGIADDTVIVLTTDHYPYGLDEPYLEELYGFDVKNKFDRDHNRLIIWSGCLEDREPIVVDEPTGVLDILPTLSNLFGTEFDSRLFPGRDVFSDAPVLVFNMSYDWKTEYGTYIASKNKFYPVSDDLVIPDSYVSAIKQIVKNKVRYCELVLDSDYFRSLFPNG